MQGHLSEAVKQQKQQAEGGQTLGISVCIEEEAAGFIKPYLLTQIDPVVFEHDFPPQGPPDGH